MQHLRRLHENIHEEVREKVLKVLKVNPFVHPTIN